MRKGRGVGYLRIEVQSSHFRVWGTKLTREMQRGWAKSPLVIYGHTFRVTAVTTVILLQCVKLGRIGILPDGLRAKGVRSVCKGMI